MSLSKARRKLSDNHRKPLAEHQFKKGVSGNPNGRSRKKLAPADGGLGSGIEDRLSAMALDEANRLVTIREGGKILEITAIQAVLRTMFGAAVKGDIRAARDLVAIVGRAESGRAMRAQDNAEAAIKHKVKYGPMFEEHERTGRDPPEIYPHPEDLLIDDDTGEVTIDGPTSKEHAGTWKAVRKATLRAMPRYFELEEALEKDPKNRALREEFEELQPAFEFVKKDLERTKRLEALQEARWIATNGDLELDEGDEEPDNSDAQG